MESDIGLAGVEGLSGDCSLASPSDGGHDSSDQTDGVTDTVGGDTSGVEGDSSDQDDGDSEVGALGDLLLKDQDGQGGTDDGVQQSCDGCESGTEVGRGNVCSEHGAGSAETCHEEVLACSLKLDCGPLKLGELSEGTVPDEQHNRTGNSVESCKEQTCGQI